MIGLIINILSVAAGGLAGTLLSSRLSEEFTAKLNMVFGVCAISMGISSIVLMQNMPAVILSVVVGTVIGLLLHLGACLTAVGSLLQKPLAGLMEKRMAGRDKAEMLSLLVTAIVLFCASGTGIYGCLDAGMTGNATVLLSKSILDFFTAMVFACTLGPVVSFIAIPQSAVFAALFLLARVILPLTTPTMINDFKACGGVLLIATGLRIAKIRDFPVADMIPAMVLAMPLSALWTGVIAPLL